MFLKKAYNIGALHVRKLLGAAGEGFVFATTEEWLTSQKIYLTYVI